MTYHFTINIKPCVNFHTHAAEISIVDHTYDGLGGGIIVRQKHLGTCPSNDLAEQAAEKFCEQLHHKLKVLCQEHCAHLHDAKP